MKRSLSLGILIIGLFTAHAALASALPDQTNGATLASTTAPWTFVQTLGTGLTGSVSALQIKSLDQAAPQVQLCASDVATTTNCYNNETDHVFCAGRFTGDPVDPGTEPNWNLVDTANGTGDCPGSTTSTAVFDPAKYYYFELLLWSTCSAGSCPVYGANYDAYAGGSCYHTDQNDTMVLGDCGGVDDIFWTTNATSTTSTAEISFIVPKNGTTTGLFNEWEVNTTGTPLFASCSVNYGLYPTTSTYTDYAPCPLEGFNTIPQIGGALYTPSLTIPIHWAAEAEVKDTGGNIVASTYEDFYLDPNFGGFATSTSMTGTCQAANNVLEYDICSIIVFLFYPSQSSVAQFSNLKAVFGKKPPFGYFGAISTALSGLQNGTSTFSLMDASTTNNFSGIFTPVRVGLIGILWFFFAWWAFHRFRHIEL